MSKMKLKLMFAGALVACAFGGIAIGIAWATPGQGVTRTILTGPVLLEDIHTRSDSDVNKVKIDMKGSSDVYIAHYRIAAGGHTGWHSHPGPCLVTVKSGQATVYCACEDPITRVVYPAGAGFVEDAGCVHLVRNEGATDLELVVLHIVPLGGPVRIDEPAP